MPYHCQLVETLADVPSYLWHTASNPFTSLAYWQALENNKLIGTGTDWQSVYLLVMTDQHGTENASTEEKNTTKDSQQPCVAMLPIFIKDHHAGEYVFDHSWAHAFHQYGINYYPRLVSSVPFTPVVGSRIWLAPQVTLSNDIIMALDSAVDQLAVHVQAPTWHGLFITEQQANYWQTSYQETLEKNANEHTDQQALPLLERHGCQFLWRNESNEKQKFTNFDDFLAKLTSKKRKNIRAERKKIASQTVKCHWKLADESERIALTKNDALTDIVVAPDTISSADWQIFYQCYAMTYTVRGQRPYLSLAFFQELAKTMPKHLAMAQATDADNNIIACSLFFYDDSQLYGRYWGCLEDIHFLHFELCYYQGISFAIAKGLQFFDPGTQGEHKLIRGFEPTKTYSLHKVYVPEFIPAIKNYCTQEQEENVRYMAHAQQSLPFKQTE